MNMRFDKFTVKAQEAIQAAEQEARQRDHQGLQGVHLLAALLKTAVDTFYSVKA